MTWLGFQYSFTAFFFQCPLGSVHLGLIYIMFVSCCLLRCFCFHVVPLITTCLVSALLFCVICTAWSNGLVSMAQQSSLLPLAVLIKSVTFAHPLPFQAVQKIPVKFSIYALFPLFSHSLFINNTRPFSKTSLCFLLLFLSKYCHHFHVTGLETIQCFFW